MSVYFLQPVDGGPVKIGCSSDVPKRVKELEQQFGRSLVLLATMPGSFAEENEIHRRFSHLRFPGTEQFRPEPELMDFIGRPQFANASPVVEPMRVAPDSAGQCVVLVYKADSSVVPALKTWLEGLADHLGVSLDVLFDIALKEFALSKKFPDPMPKRLSR